MYYVYAYLRNDNTPYYIGKGTGKRAWSKNHPGIGVPKDLTKIKILFESLNEEEAHSKEKELILHYGRKDLNTGILYNRTAGGEGSSGRILTDESIEKIRKKALQQHKQSKSGFNMGHASDAGKVGGKAKTTAKLNAAKTNLEKTREIHKNSVWIHNPTTGKRKRVKEHMLHSFTSQGFVRGFAV